MWSSEARQVVAIVVAFIAGATLAWIPLNSASLPFREASTYPLWVFLIALVCGSCPVVWSHGKRGLAQLPARRSPVLEWLGYGTSAITLIVTVSVVPTLFPRHVPGTMLLPHLGARLAAVYFAVAVALAPSGITIYRIGGASLRDDVHAADLVAWRSVLQSQLAVLGALIALGTLTTAALRNAILTAFTARSDDFPAEYILLFGASLTMVLTLVYVPPSERLRRRAQAVVDEVFPMPNQFDGDWQQQLQRRRDLTALLGLEETSRDSIQSALIIGGPLITSALTLLIPAR